MLLLDWTYAIDYCRNHGGFSFTVLLSYLEKDITDRRTFYSISFGLKILCAEDFPGFTLDDYEELEFIPRPHSRNWGIYQEIDNILEPLEKNMISAGLFEMAAAIRHGENYSLSTLRNAAILGLTYVTGARPVQLARLATKDLRIDTRNPETGLVRYSVLLPYAKQRRVTPERPPDAINALVVRADTPRLCTFMGTLVGMDIPGSIRATLSNLRPDFDAINLSNAAELLGAARLIDPQIAIFWGADDVRERLLARLTAEIPWTDKIEVEAPTGGRLLRSRIFHVALEMSQHLHMAG